MILLFVKRCVIIAVARRSEASRSLSLPENKLIASSPQQQQPTSSVSSSSLIASLEEKCLRTSVDSGAVDRKSSLGDVSSTVCDVVTQHDVPSPIRNVRPARLDLAAVQSSKVDSSPDDRKQLVGILLNRSPRRTNTLLGFVVLLITLYCHPLPVSDDHYFFIVCIF